MLSKKPVLQFFYEKLSVVLSCDAAKDGIGNVLLQNNLPVAILSKSVSPTQQASNRKRMFRNFISFSVIYILQLNMIIFATVSKNDYRGKEI